MEQVTYTSDSQLRTPRVLLAELIGDLKATRALGWRLFITELRSKYRQSLLGYFWILVPPLLTAVIWIFLGRWQILNTRTDSSLYPVFVISGIFIWQSFVEAIDLPIQTLSARKTVITKVKAPHEAFVLAGFGGIAFNLAVRMGLLLLLIIVLFPVGLHFTLLLVPFGLLTVMALGLSIGLVFTPVGLLYGDVRNALMAVTSLWFFVTPIIYQIPKESRISQFLVLNPVTPLLNTTRDWIIRGEFTVENGFFVVLGLSLLMLLAAWFFYRIAKPHIITRISS